MEDCCVIVCGMQNGNRELCCDILDHGMGDDGMRYSRLSS